MTYTSEQLADALAAAARYGYRPPPLVYSSLRPYRPPKPPRLSAPVSRDIVADPIPDVPAISEPPSAAERLRNVLAPARVFGVSRGADSEEVSFRRFQLSVIVTNP